MSDSAWTSMWENLPGTLWAVAVLVGILKGLVDINSLKFLMNGHHTEMIKIVGDAKKTEGKVEAIQEMVKPTTTVIKDRRGHKDERAKDKTG